MSHLLLPVPFLLCREPEGPSVKTAALSAAPSFSNTGSNHTLNIKPITICRHNFCKEKCYLLLAHLWQFRSIWVCKALCNILFFKSTFSLGIIKDITFPSKFQLAQDDVTNFRLYGLHTVCILNTNTHILGYTDNISGEVCSRYSIYNLRYIHMYAILI